MELFSSIHLGRTKFSSGRDEPTRRGSVAEAILWGQPSHFTANLKVEGADGSMRRITFLGRAFREQGQLSGPSLYCSQN